jgi:hypothetical protein
VRLGAVLMVWWRQEQTRAARRATSAHDSRNSGRGFPTNDHDDLQVFRQWMILRTLGARRHGMSIRDLAAARGVDQQTIRRDLKTLKLLGFPLEETEGPRGRKV